MSLVNNFLRHRFLIERLRMAACSLGDFEDDLAHSGEYAEVKSFSKRTLQRDIKDIREIYHIDIQYNKSIKKYEIVEDNDLYAQNLFEAFDVFRALQNHGNLSKLIAFDHRYPKGTSHPAGTQHLSTLLQAIKQKKQLQLHYYKFWGSKEVQVRTIEPYLLKESQHRWYVLALDVDKKALRIFGLDRIRAIEDRGMKRMQRPPQGIERFLMIVLGYGWITTTLKPKKLSYPLGETKRIRLLHRILLNTLEPCRCTTLKSFSKIPLRRLFSRYRSRLLPTLSRRFSPTERM